MLPTMMTCTFDGDVQTLARAHPWTTTTANPAHRYYDLRATPALIRTSLEDLLPWTRHPAIETFYTLLEWLNGPGSTLESNDCAFEGPEPCEDVEGRGSLECSGRVMLLFRNLARNVEGDDLADMTGALHASLAQMDPRFGRGVIGTTLIPVDYVTREAPASQHGAQLMLSFWAWGRSEDECMISLGRLLTNLARAVREVDTETR
jgi:hypothetical protein